VYKKISNKTKYINRKDFREMLKSHGNATEAVCTRAA
jgi:hypothetical protein